MPTGAAIPRIVPVADKRFILDGTDGATYDLNNSADQTARDAATAAGLAATAAQEDADTAQADADAAQADATQALADAAAAEAHAQTGITNAAGALTAANNAASDAAAAQTTADAAEPDLGNPDVDGKVLRSTAAGVRSWVAQSVASGDVVGPGSATNNSVALFDGTTGKLIKDGGALPTGNATHTGDVTGATALTLATAQPSVHTWALAQTFTVAPVFTDTSGTRTALGLGTLATQSGTFSGTSSGTNTGDQTNISGNAATVTTNANLTGHITSTGNAAVLGSFTIAQLNTAISDADAAILGLNTFTALQTITQASANSGILASTGYSLTGSNTTKAIDITGTLNTSGSVTAVSIVLTNTASGANSRCLAIGTTGAQFSLGMSGQANVTDVANAGFYVGADSPMTTYKLFLGKSVCNFISGQVLGWAASSTQAEGAKDVTLSRNAAGTLQIGTTAANASGKLLLAGLTVAAGTAVNGIRHGVSGAMVSGTVTVTDAGCTANTRYFFSAHTLGTITIPGAYYVSTRNAGTSFVITSSQATETSTIDWLAIEP